MQRRVIEMILLAIWLILGMAGPVGAAFPKSPVTKCPGDAVVAGPGCLDKYEASVWRVPNATTGNASLVKKIQKGTATAADLTAAGANQLGLTTDNYGPTCTDNGQTCANDIYAVSLPGMTPSRFITWLQANQACENAGKRLPSNAEWQAAVVGTPDPGPDNGSTDCNTNSTLAVAATGSRSGCVSADGAFDMVGNVYEWVADWMPASTACPGWGGFSNDFMCLSGASTTLNGPGALRRGGNFQDGTGAGPLAVDGSGNASMADGVIGFRCVR